MVSVTELPKIPIYGNVKLLARRLLVRSRCHPLEAEARRRTVPTQIHRNPSQIHPQFPINLQILNLRISNPQFTACFFTNETPLLPW